jgi:hypothetical protein
MSRQKRERLAKCRRVTQRAPMVSFRVERLGEGKMFCH